MALFDVVQHTVGDSNADGTTYTINWPSAVTTGNVLVVCASIDGVGTLSMITAGYSVGSADTGVTSGGRSAHGAMWYKVANGAAQTSVQVDSTDAGIINVWIGEYVNDGTAIILDRARLQSAEDHASPAASPAGNTTAATTLNIAHYAYEGVNNAIGSPSWDNGYTARSNQIGLTATQTGAIATASMVRTSAGAAGVSLSWSADSPSAAFITVISLAQWGGPVVAANGGEVGTSLGSNNAQTLPTGSTTGDLIVVLVSHDNPGVTAITASTGWTTIYTQVQGSNVVKAAAFGRVLDGGANDTLTISGAAQDYVVDSYRIAAGTHGVTNAGLATEIKDADATGATGNADPPSLDAGSSKKWMWLTHATVDHTATGNSVSAIPANYTLGKLTKSASSTTSVGLGGAYRYLETQTEDPGTFTNTSLPWIAATIAIPPAAAAATTSLPPLPFVRRSAFRSILTR